MIALLVIVFTKFEILHPCLFVIVFYYMEESCLPSLPDYNLSFKSVAGHYLSGQISLWTNTKIEITTEES